MGTCGQKVAYFLVLSFLLEAVLIEAFKPYITQTTGYEASTFNCPHPVTSTVAETVFITITTTKVAYGEETVFHHVTNTKTETIVLPIPTVKPVTKYLTTLVSSAHTLTLETESTVTMAKSPTFIEKTLYLTPTTTIVKTKTRTITATNVVDTSVTTTLTDRYTSVYGTVVKETCLVSRTAIARNNFVTKTLTASVVVERYDLASAKTKTINIIETDYRLRTFTSYLPARTVYSTETKTERITLQNVKHFNVYSTSELLLEPTSVIKQQTCSNYVNTSIYTNIIPVYTISTIYSQSSVISTKIDSRLVTLTSTSIESNLNTLIAKTVDITQLVTYKTVGVPLTVLTSSTATITNTDHFTAYTYVENIQFHTTTVTPHCTEYNYQLKEEPVPV